VTTRSRKSRSWLTRISVPGIGGQHLLQEIEGFEIEIVGGLVEDQEVRRLRQRAGEHQPAALAAGQRLHRRARLLGAEEEVLHVADDVAALAADDDRVAAPAGEHVGDRVSGSRLARLWSSAAARDWRRGGRCRNPARARR
jgi:hypothetical protein